MDDLWLFDLSNLGAGGSEGAEPCPWVELDSSTGVGRSAGTLSWDPVGERFVLAGGWETDSDGQRASDGVFTLDLASAASGTGFATATTLPAVTYGAAEIGDHETPLIWPAAACTGGLSGPVLVKANDSMVVALLASIISDSNLLCDEAGYLDEELVDVWGYVDPCTNVVWTDVDGDGEDELLDWSGGEIYYGTSCMEDPFCESGSLETLWTTASVAGLAEHAATVDPGTGTVYFIAGTTGCEGMCGEWEDLFELDLAGSQALQAANADPVVAFASTAGLQGEGSTVSVPSSLPDGADFGRRGAGAAPAGVYWSHSTRQWEADDFSTVLVGGTLHQEVGPGRQHELSCDLAICTGYCASYSDSWSGLPATYNIATGEGLVTSVVSTAHDGGGWTEVGTLPESLYPAVTWFGLNRLLVAGGVDGSGTLDTVRLVEATDASVVESNSGTAMGSRWGAAMVYDPVVRQALLFGGHDTNARMISIEHTDAVAPGAGGTWEVDGTVEVGIAHDVSAGRWTSSVLLPLRYGCDGDCFAQDLVLSVRSNDTAELDSLAVSVAYADDPTSVYDLVPYDVALTTTGAGATFRLPRIVSDGDGLLASASFDRVVDSSTADDAFGCWGAAPMLQGLCHFSYGNSTDGWLDLGVPVLPWDWPDSVEVTTSFDVGSWSGLAPGTPDTLGTAFGPFPGMLHIKHPTFVFSGGLTEQGSGGAADHAMHGWADDGLGAASSDAAAWLQGTSTQNLPDGVNWLEARLGPVPNADRHVVLLRENASVETSQGLAYTDRGISLVLFADAAGDLQDEHDPASAAFHEVVHHWVPYFRPEATVSDNARWFTEGIPTLAEWMVDPAQPWHLDLDEDGSDDDLDGDGWADQPPASEAGHFVLQAMAQRGCEGDRTDLEADAASSKVVRYEFAAFTLAQVYFTWLERCSPDQVASGACGPDSDGDGWPGSGDCDDTVGAAHPDQPAESGTGTDDNCDTWVHQP